LALLLVAEITAKIVYNATDATDPFDEHSAYALSAVARGRVKELRDPAFEDNVWRALLGR
jgi:hypothetical protein